MMSAGNCPTRYCTTRHETAMQRQQLHAAQPGAPDCQQPISLRGRPPTMPSHPLLTHSPAARLTSWQQHRLLLSAGNWRQQTAQHSTAQRRTVWGRTWSQHRSTAKADMQLLRAHTASNSQSTKTTPACVRTCPAPTAAASAGSAPPCRSCAPRAPLWRAGCCTPGAGSRGTRATRRRCCWYSCARCSCRRQHQCLHSSRLCWALVLRAWAVHWRRA